MYTINPLPIVDTLNKHGGFWFVAVTCSIAYLIVIMTIADGFYDTFWKCVAASITRA